MSVANASNPVAVSGLTKVFRDFWGRPTVRAVDGLDLTVGPGEVFGLLGPNGSGKSTTIKILLGLLRATSGEVAVLGQPPDAVAVKQRIGYLPEESYLYNYLTPRETLDFYGKLFNLGRATRRERVDQLLTMTGLTQAADRPVGAFSKGMARRVGLAQALINDPQLVILDEPTSGLDPLGCRQVKDLILSLSRLGKTVLLTSHLLADVEDVCQRLVILFNGRVRAAGGVSELLTRSDRCRLTVPTLTAGQMQQALQALRAVAGVEPEVDRPALNLEQFFLQVVADAAGGATPAAAPAIAPFLAEGRG